MTVENRPGQMDKTKRRKDRVSNPIPTFAKSGAGPGRAFRDADRHRDHDLARRARRVEGEIRNAATPQNIENIPVGNLTPNPRNARTHPESQIGLLTNSIRKFGFIGAITIDENGVIIAGHGRFEAAKRLGMQTVPCIRLSKLTAADKLALAIADNRLAELSGWDKPLLGEILCGLTTAEIDFDFEVTGFDSVDLDGFLAPEPDPRRRKAPVSIFSEDPDDKVIAPEKGASVSRAGDLWMLGTHRLLHGDALDRLSYVQLLDDETVTQVIADPPYNVSARHISSKGFRNFQSAAGEMTRKEFRTYLSRILALCSDVVCDGAIFHTFMDWKHLADLSDAAEAAGLTPMNMCVWVKPYAGMGSFYRSQHELVLVYKSGRAAHINNFGLGARGRSRSNAWFYPSVRGVRRGVNDPDGGHPTVKPISMIIDAIRDCSGRGDLILDPTGGSGTTMIAAERMGRRARLIEIDGLYVDLSIRRWQGVTGCQATRVSDGATFDSLSATNDAAPEVDHESGEVRS
jgi:DNA modification methylase